MNKEEEMKTMITVIKIRALSSINELFRHSLECTHARLSYLTSDLRAQSLLDKGTGDGNQGTREYNGGCGVL